MRTTLDIDEDVLGAAKELVPSGRIYPPAKWYLNCCDGCSRVKRQAMPLHRRLALRRVLSPVFNLSLRAGQW